MLRYEHVHNLQDSTNFLFFPHLLAYAKNYNLVESQLLFFF